MNMLFRLGLWLVERISLSENREALCGDLLEQWRTGRSNSWLARELFVALVSALRQRFGRYGIPILFSLTWSSLYRGYAAPQLRFFNPAWVSTLELFPLRPVATLLMQIVPVISFIWIGFALFLCIRRDVFRSMTLTVFTLALSASHAAFLVLTIVWRKPAHSPSLSLINLLAQPAFHLGWVNVPVALSMLIAIVCVLPAKGDPPRKRRRSRVRLEEAPLQSRLESAGVLRIEPVFRKRSRFQFCLLVVLALSTLPLAAQQARTPLTAEQLAAIDRFVSGEMQRERIPGLALGVYSRGTVLLAKGYGLSNVELNVPVMPETMFQSGSVGKQFLATAVLMLVEEGKLSLDDSIAKYFPNAPATWQAVRIKNLLSHTSGLAEYESPERTSAAGPFYLRLDFSEDELVGKIEALPIESAPGERWAYRNTNYVLLGILIHRVAGVPYGTFLTQRIFRPLGMAATRLISEADIVPNRAAGYELVGDVLRNQQWVSPTFNSTGDGTLYLNVLDLAKWDAALYTTHLLKQSSLNQMWAVFPLNDGKPNPGSYGFGWELDPQNGHRRMEHGGSWQGFSCEISRYPDDALTVVVLTNLDSAHARPAMFSHVIAGLIQPQLAPPKLAAIPDDTPEVGAALRRLLDSVVADEDVHSELSADFAKLITPAAVKGVESRLRPLWPGGTLTLVRRAPASPQSEKRISLFRLKKGDESVLISIACDREGKVSAFGFHADSEY